MCPKEAMVIHIDDDESCRGNVEWFLSSKGHKVIVGIGTREEAENVILSGILHEADIVILDGNLTSGDGSGKDGLEIAQEIRNLQNPPHIIEHSGGEYGYGDLSVPKGDPTEIIDTMEKLVQVVTELPPRKLK